ncbi:uncharacterized protein [Primulina eburnea]|uniref:uncharacterized protein n=1 Tax=Primulina eburnea TaxID=1245227 RepID=UPI003C6C0200
MAHFSKVPMFSKEDFDDWKIRMHAHLAAQDDDIWYVITDGPLKILNPNPAIAITESAPQMLEKPRYEWTSEDKKKVNLDNVAKDILFKTLNKNTFSKIKMCHTAKEIWEKLIQICEENEETKENKLSIVNELSALGKDFGNREIALKVMRGLPREWDVKTMAMRASRDLNKLEFHDLFSDLKAYEFELEVRIGEEPLANPPTKALAATVNSTTTVAPSSSAAAAIENTSERSAEQISNDTMSLFVKKFSKFMKKNHRTFQSPNRNFKKESSPSDMACFNCGKRKKGFKRNDKKTRRDRKAMIAEESKSKWADSSSESSGSENHSSESDEDEIKCLMANTDSTSTYGEEQVKKTKISSSTWYLDSGCSRHMTGQKSLLSEVVNCVGPEITFGDISEGKTVGKDKIIHGNITIKDVLLIENLCYNLISISQLCDNGFSVAFQKHTCTVKNADNSTVLTGIRKGQRLNLGPYTPPGSILATRFSSLVVFQATPVIFHIFR